MSGKANFINKILVRDWTTLQAKTKARYDAYKEEFDHNKYVMDSHELAECNGYMLAMTQTMDFMCQLMASWPDLDAHRKNSSSTMT